MIRLTVPGSKVIHKKSPFHHPFLWHAVSGRQQIIRDRTERLCGRRIHNPLVRNALHSDSQCAKVVHCATVTIGYNEHLVTVAPQLYEIRNDDAPQVRLYR